MMRIKAFDTSRERFGLGQMEEKNKQLLSVLEGLFEKKLPNTESTWDDLAFFCLDLVLDQWDTFIPELNGAWCFQQNTFEPVMPNDAQIDFIHKPTYLAVSILAYVAMEYPDIASQIDGYYETLKRGLAFSAKTRLLGHAKKEADDLVEFLGYFVKGQVMTLLIKDPGFCPEFYSLLLKVKEEIGQAIKDQRFYDLLGTNLEKQLKSIDEQLFML